MLIYPLCLSQRCFTSMRSHFFQMWVVSRRKWCLWETFRQVMPPSWSGMWCSATMGRSAARWRTRPMSMGTLEKFNYGSLLQVRWSLCWAQVLITLYIRSEHKFSDLILLNISTFFSSSFLWDRYSRCGHRGCCAASDCCPGHLRVRTAVSKI